MSRLPLFKGGLTGLYIIRYILILTGIESLINLKNKDLSIPNQLLVIIISMIREKEKI